MEAGRIAMFELTISNDQVQIIQERHYQLVPASAISTADLQRYRHSSAIDH